MYGDIWRMPEMLTSISDNRIEIAAIATAQLKAGDRIEVNIMIFRVPLPRTPLLLSDEYLFVTRKFCKSIFVMRKLKCDFRFLGAQSETLNMFTVEHNNSRFLFTGRSGDNRNGKRMQ